MTDTGDFTALEQQVLDEFAKREAASTEPLEDGEVPAPSTPPADPPADPATPAGDDPATLDPHAAPGEPFDGEVQTDPLASDDADEITALDIDGTEYTIEQIDAALKVKQWADGLDETAIQTVDAALSGDYVLVPLADLPAIQRFYESQNAPPTATPPPATGPQPTQWDQPLPFDDEVDPRVAQLEAQVGQLTEAQQRAQEAQQIEWARQQIDQTTEAFYASNPDITAEDRSRIEDAIIQNGTYAALAQIHPPGQAIQMALTQAAAVDQAIQARRIQAQVDAQVAQQITSLHQQAQQTAGSTALSGTSAPMSRQQVAPQDPETALASAIARAMQNGS